MRKNNVVLWSGGFDSTLILHDLIQKGLVPIALCVTHPNNKGFEMEKISRDKLERKLGKFVRMDFIEGKKEDSIEEFTQDYWLDCVFKHMPNDSNVYMGIHRLQSEREGRVRHEFSQFIDNFNATAINKGLSLTLELPLEEMYKEDILKQIYKIGIYDDCWTCENPQGILPCGECMPCKRVSKWENSK